jgi:hypothetical protein
MAGLNAVSSDCCTTGQQASCCEPSDKQACCTAEASSCGCSVDLEANYRGRVFGASRYRDEQTSPRRALRDL